MFHLFFPIICSLFYHLQTYSQQVEERSIKVGLLMANSSPDLISAVGYQTSASAALIPLDRIRAEGVLSNTNFTFEWYFDECEPYKTSGYLTKLILQDKADVVFGPTCQESAKIAGIIGRFYNFPIFIWGVAMPSALLSSSEYPTTSVIISTTYSIAIAFVSILNHYQWSEFALVYSLNRSSRIPRCSYIQQDIEDEVDMLSNITLTYKRQLDFFDNNKVEKVLNSIKSRARVVAACLETDYERREFIKAVIKTGMNTNDYTYIFLEMRKKGYGDPPFWTDQREEKDGMDEEIKNACKLLLIVDYQLVDMSLTAFHEEVIERMKDYPFYCTVACENYTEASIQSPYLADTMYIYARAINRTLTADPVNGLSNGKAINAATKGVYAGYTGRVVIDGAGNRSPIYMLFGMNKHEESEVFVVIETYKNSSGCGLETCYDNAPLGMITTGKIYPEEVVVKSWQPTYTDEATSIWAVRGGVRPLSKPKCGFTGVECVPTFLEAYSMYVIIAAVVFALMAALLASVGIYTVRWRRKERKRLDRLWQINYACLIKPVAKTDVAKSRRSLQSVATSMSTREMFDKVSETTSRAFYYLFDEAVVAGKHTARPRIGEKEAAELRLMRQMDHENLNKFIGLCTDSPQYLSVWKFCSRGSLKDIIEKGTFTMDAFFIVSIILDLCEGLIAIHRSPIGHHGHLTSSVCLVDERWLVKISNFGLSFLKQIEQRPEDTLLWTAPEHLRESNSVGSKPGDVYSFAIICSEIITRKSAFDIDDDNRNVEEVVHKIKRRSPDPFRPEISTADLQGIPLAMLHLIRGCWSENPEARPKIEKVKEVLKSMHRGGNLMDHIFSMLEEHANNLEAEIEGRTRELVEEKKKSDILLQRMLPKQVAERLKLGQSVSPESFESVTVFFSDVVQFTNLASRCTPLQVVSLLNDLYTTFDTIIDGHNVYKVETIGDGYMCVSGLPHRNGNEHAKDIAEMSFALLRTLNTFRVPHLPNEKINIRIGINTGPVVAGVVGLSMPRYCLFGDTVNTASRMESNGKPGHIHISPETNRYLTEIIGGYRTESRGEVIIKGKGVMETFWLIPPEGLPTKVEPSQ